MKSSQRKIIIVISVICIFMIAVAVGRLWVDVFGWPTFVVRDSQYRKLIADFKQAQRRERLWHSEENVTWDFQVQLPEAQTTVGVKAYAYPSVVRVTYTDEGWERRLYAYVDYSHPMEVRTAGNIIYVRWNETLISSEDWLMAYDLTTRREILRRKIDPDDLKQAH